MDEIKRIRENLKEIKTLALKGLGHTRTIKWTPRERASNARHYRALEMRVAGASYKEIGEKLGVSAGRAHYMISSVLRKVRWGTLPH